MKYFKPEKIQLKCLIAQNCDILATKYDLQPMRMFANDRSTTCNHRLTVYSKSLERAADYTSRFTHVLTRFFRILLFLGGFHALFPYRSTGLGQINLAQSYRENTHLFEKKNPNQFEQGKGEFEGEM